MLRSARKHAPEAGRVSASQSKKVTLTKTVIASANLATFVDQHARDNRWDREQTNFRANIFAVGAYGGLNVACHPLALTQRRRY